MSTELEHAENATHIDTEWRWWEHVGDQNLIKQNNLFRSDVDLQRRIFIDACLHSGFKVEYFEAVKEKRDIYQDPVTEWKQSAILPCIIDEHPKIQLLKSYGWYEADQEIQGQILYLSIYRNWETKEILDLQDQSLFRIHYFGQNFPSDFRLVSKRMDSVYGVYWICRIAPEHLDNFYYVTDHGTHFLKKKSDNTVNCEHKEKEDTSIDKRVYQHEDLEAYLFGKEGLPAIDNMPYKDEVNNGTREFKSYSQLIMEDDD